MIWRPNVALRVGLPTVLVLFSIASAGCAKKAGQVDVTGTPDSNGDRADANKDGMPADGGSGTQSGVTLKDVYFGFDEHTLTTEARSRLAENAGVLREAPGIRATIEGHCDERGTVEYNLALGQRRAESTLRYLGDLGVDRDRLTAVSYGEERPFEIGHDESSWSQNRRAHFVIAND